MRKTITADNVLRTYIPNPTPVPTAAVAQTVAAVVNPWVRLPLCIMMPAPKNPIPTTMLAAMRDGSAPGMCCEMSANTHAPMATAA